MEKKSSCITPQVTSMDLSAFFQQVNGQYPIVPLRYLYPQNHIRMKNSFPLCALLFVALAFGFTSCKKDSGNSNPDGEYYLKIKIDGKTVT